MGQKHIVEAHVDRLIGQRPCGTLLHGSIRSGQRRCRPCHTCSDAVRGSCTPKPAAIGHPPNRAPSRISSVKAAWVRGGTDKFSLGRRTDHQIWIGVASAIDRAAATNVKQRTSTCQEEKKKISTNTTRHGYQQDGAGCTVPSIGQLPPDDVPHYHFPKPARIMDIGNRIGGKMDTSVISGAM